MTRISVDDALAIAKTEAAARGWPWVEPVHASGRLYSRRFMTNSTHRGGNVNIVVRLSDGKVLRAGYATR